MSFIPFLLIYLVLPISTNEASASDALKQLNVWVKPNAISGGFSVQVQGQLNSTWNGKCIQTKNKKQCKKLHTFGEYQDAFTLEYTFDDASSFEFGVPTVSSNGGRANAMVTDFSTDVEERRGEIHIEHSCTRLTKSEIKTRAGKTTGDDISIISLKYVVAKDNVFEMSWRKICGYGEHEALDYGIELSGGSARSLRYVGKGRNKSPKIIVAPDATSTRVYFRAEGGAGIPRFDDPFVKTEIPPRMKGNEDAVATVSTFVRGWEASDTGAKFVVLYGCSSRGRVDVRSTIALPPYNNVTMIWTKDCGGGLEPSLMIRNVAKKLNRQEGGSIISNGVTGASFGRASQLARENSVQHSTIRMRFNVVIREGVNLGVASIESSDDGTVRPRVWIEDGSSVMVEASCKRIGEAHIYVTLPIQDRVPAEWAFYKRCNGPQNSPRNLRVIAGALILISAVFLILYRVVKAVPIKPALRKSVRFERVDSRAE